MEEPRLRRGQGQAQGQGCSGDAGGRSSARARPPRTPRPPGDGGGWGLAGLFEVRVRRGPSGFVGPPWTALLPTASRRGPVRSGVRAAACT